ncbi:unnamed protein product [Bursaphelenchus xylophilus]|uniref:(pine wood nematode) hypothetical protein n=1 Tax=Bursaphelenchus xylophilus TaxID=6326 RepID=A0A7I8X3C3_BURXY|nr:unnamed protein product [Bursaphelenchus xylophilus]CAG9131296.1 unnamed protein product [Bursaphelenchus xylophilus]
MFENSAHLVTKILSFGIRPFNAPKMNKLVFALLISAVVADVKITVVNKCKKTVWPGVFGQGTIPENGGFELAPGAQKVLTVPDGWVAGRIWPRTGCTGSGENFQCETGACGTSLQCNGKTGETPCSLAEITLAKTTNDKDFYDISFVDGSNIPMSMQPVAGTFNTAGGSDKYYCTKAGECNKDLKTIVPANMQFKKNGKVVGTLSACSATNDPKYCCSGAYSTPDKCKGDTFPPQYYKDLKAACPTTYIYAYDDPTSTFSCKGKGKPSPDYTVTFCTESGIGL